MLGSHRHQADKQKTTVTRELWALPTSRDLSAPKAVMQTATGNIIAAWKGRANTFGLFYLIQRPSRGSAHEITQAVSILNSVSFDQAQDMPHGQIVTYKIEKF